ncbi:hypothetical protein BASA62_005350 [Batrachochytrium salamandrivorans]|nr:hypothetical protein BASA62_005350 [Batrachochytrium salamandrivorans]
MLEFYHLYVSAAILLALYAAMQATQWWKRESYRRAQRAFFGNRTIVSRQSRHQQQRTAHNNSPTATKTMNSSRPMALSTSNNISATSLTNRSSMHHSVNRIGQSKNGFAAYTPMVPAARISNHHTPAMSLDLLNTPTPTSRLLLTNSSVGRGVSTAQQSFPTNSRDYMVSAPSHQSKGFYTRPTHPGLGVESPFTSGVAKESLQMDIIRQKEVNRPVARSFFTPVPKPQSRTIAIPTDVTPNFLFEDPLLRGQLSQVSSKALTAEEYAKYKSKVEESIGFMDYQDDSRVEKTLPTTISGTRKRHLLLGEREYHQHLADAQRTKDAVPTDETPSRKRSKVHDPLAAEVRKLAKVRKSKLARANGSRSTRRTGDSKRTPLRSTARVRLVEHENNLPAESDTTPRKSSQKTLSSTTLLKSALKRRSTDDSTKQECTDDTSLTLESDAKYTRLSSATPQSSKRKVSYGLFDDDDNDRYPDDPNDKWKTSSEMRPEDGWITPATRKAGKRLKMESNESTNAISTDSANAPKPALLPKPSNVTNESGRIYLSTTKKRDSIFAMASPKAFKGILDDDEADVAAIRMVRASKVMGNSYISSPTGSVLPSPDARAGLAAGTNGTSPTSNPTVVAVTAATLSAPTFSLTPNHAVAAKSIASPANGSPLATPLFQNMSSLSPKPNNTGASTTTTTTTTAGLFNIPAAATTATVAPMVNNTPLSLSDRLGKRSLETGNSAPLLNGSSPTSSGAVAPAFTTTASLFSIPAKAISAVDSKPLSIASTAMATAPVVATSTPANVAPLSWSFNAPKLDSKSPMAAPVASAALFQPQSTTASQISPKRPSTGMGLALSASTQLPQSTQTMPLFGTLAAQLPTSVSQSTAMTPNGATLATTAALGGFSAPILTSVAAAPPPSLFSGFGSTQPPAPSTSAAIVGGFGATTTSSTPITAPAFPSFGTASQVNPTPLFGGAVAPQPIVSTAATGSAATLQAPPKFVFGGATPQSNTVPAFGATSQSNTVPAFGATSQSNTVPAFGAAPQFNTVPAFGAAPQSNTVPAFGATSQSNTVPPFGAAPQSNTVPAFGAAPQSNTAPAFGAAPPFGAAPQSNIAPAFGAASQSNTVPAFGAAPQSNTAPAFGAAPPFGAAPQSNIAPAFGAAPQSNIAPAFGAAPQSNTAPAFGAAPQSNPAPAFGGFGASKPAASSGPFVFGASSASTPAFGASSVAGPGFGTTAPPAVPPFASSGASTNSFTLAGPTSTMGGATNAFGSAPPPAFGQSLSQPAPTPIFGQQQQATPQFMPFGSGQAQPQPMFGQQQQQPQQAPPGSGFSFSAPALPGVSVMPGQSNAAPGGFSFGMSAGQAPVFATTGTAGVTGAAPRKFAMPKSRKGFGPGRPR